MKKHLKVIGILFVIAIVFEMLMVVYNEVLYKFYDSKHLINNNPYIIDIEDIQTSKEGNLNILTVNKNLEGPLYNISLNLKTSNSDDAYLTLICNDKNYELRRDNLELNKFKAYLSVSEVNSVKINFSEGQININNVKNISINENLDYMPQRGIVFLRIATIFGLTFIVYLAFCIYKKINSKEYKIDKANFFVISALILGIGIGTLVIPLTKYDEHTHFWRAYEISKRHLTSSWNTTMPKSVIDLVIGDDGVYHINDRKYSDLKENLTKKLEPKEEAALFVGGAGAYSPFNYIPQLVGITIGRLMHLNPVIIAYLGRLTNFLFFILVVYTAIKIMPKEKWKNIIIVIALLPMTLSLATSMSPDSLAISLAILLISYIFKLKYDEKDIKFGSICLLSILCIMTSLVKIAYLPLIILFLLIPSNKLKNKKLYYSVFTGTMILAIVINLVWMSIAGQGGTAATRTNPTEQIYFVLSNPLGFIANLGATLVENFGEYVTTMVGGWNTTAFGELLLIIALVFTVFKENQQEKDESKIVLTKKDKIIISIAIILCVLLIFAGLYVQWTIARLNRVEGIQGRYFLPILAGVLILLESNKLKVNIKNYWLKYFIFLLIIYIPVYINIIKEFI